MQGSLSDLAFVVLCRGIVFVKCVWVCKWIFVFVKCFWGLNGLLRSFVYLFDFDCMGCGIGDCLGGIDCCGRAMSPNGAILLHSPGRKPWVRCVKTYFEPL